jgi:hypothetical protein
LKLRKYLVKFKAKNICCLIFVCISFISIFILATMKIDMNLISRTSSQKEETTIKEAIYIVYTKVKELS